MTTKARIGLTIAAALIVAGGGVTIVTHIFTNEDSKTSKPGNSSSASSQTSKPVTRYVALGDSIAAGVGLANDSDSSACNRTDQSYPHQLASKAGYTLSNLACSGATLAVGINGSQTVNKLVLPSQLDQLFGLPEPSLVTMSTGVNDIGWTRYLASCYTGNCATPANSAAIAAQLNVLAASLQKALQTYQAHYAAGKTPKLVLTGYYQLFPADAADAANCPDVAGIDKTEQQWFRQQITAVNDKLSQSVKNFPFASFASIDFSGHELCSSTSWVQGLADKQPYHPTSDGQHAISERIKTLIGDTL